MVYILELVWEVALYIIQICHVGHKKIMALGIEKPIWINMQINQLKLLLCPYGWTDSKGRLNINQICVYGYTKLENNIVQLYTYSLYR